MEQTETEPKAEAQAEHQAIAETKDQIQEAKKEIAAGDSDAAMARLGALEERLARLEEKVIHAAPQEHSHEHQWPKGFKSLLESFNDLEHDEIAPQRQHPLYRRLRTED